MLKEISIEIIRKCPNHCLHCSSLSSTSCSEIIPFEIFKQVVDGVTNLHLKTLCFSGGEPFLHPDIIKMVKYVASKGIQSYIYTSGIYMDKKSSTMSCLPADILFQLKGVVTKLIFNIEASSETSYNQIMGTQGCLPLLVQSVTSAVDFGIVCEAHLVPMKLNFGEIEQTIKFCEDIGISKISFLRLVPHGRALINKDVILLTNSELEILKKKLVKIQQNRKHSIRIGVPLTDKDTNLHCEAAAGKLNIKYDGCVYPCEVFKNLDISTAQAGIPENVFTNKIEDIYRHSVFLNNIRQYVSEECKTNNCEICAGQSYLQSLMRER